MITLGLDIGSSSIKAALVDSETGNTIAHATVPDTELLISSPRFGYAEQDPDVWWECVVEAIHLLRGKAQGALHSLGAIGISYQMHGLVLIGREGKPLLPSIIWCDSRATEIGREAFDALGHQWCLDHLLNSPGNFTASKLRWVLQHRPAEGSMATKFLLPGDYIAYRLTGEATSSIPGLSEGMFWDFVSASPSETLLHHYGIRPDLLPRLVPTFGDQGHITKEAASLLGIPKGIPVSYRAGDQPNNAFSLNVLEPGEVAATAGTSGVVYAIGDGLRSDPRSRVNAFAHVNYRVDHPRIGILLCVNGTGIANTWIRRMTGNTSVPYKALDGLAAQSPVGSKGVMAFPFGNGAERLFGDKLLGATFSGIDFTRHETPDLLRAVQEGIAFALHRGLQIMPSLGITPKVIRAGLANMFLSPIFCDTLATVTGTPLELYNTDGAGGAARGAAVGAGAYASPAEAFRGLQVQRTVEPSRASAPYYEAVERWSKVLDQILSGVK
ncbi:MAG: FGGY family carbohydrate kinase [Bacteroidota bacterium]